MNMKNVLIANFINYDDNDCEKCKYRYNCNELQCVLSDDERLELLSFDRDWNKLMPVVTKILMGSYTLNGVMKMKDVQNSLITGSIEDTFDSVCDFILWYNNY